MGLLNVASTADFSAETSSFRDEMVDVGSLTVCAYEVIVARQTKKYDADLHTSCQTSAGVRRVPVRYIVRR